MSHRIGRTARAGAEGMAISFCAGDEKPYLRDIEKLTRIKLDIVPLPENFVAQAAAMPKAPPARPERDPRAGNRGANARGNPAPRGDAERPRNYNRRSKGPVGAQSWCGHPRTLRPGTSKIQPRISAF